MTDAAGPLGRVLTLQPEQLERLERPGRPGQVGRPPTLRYRSAPLGGTANARLLMSRAAFPGAPPAAKGGDQAERAVLEWAVTRHLGQHQNPLRPAVHDRRTAALRTLSATTRTGEPLSIRRLSITALGRLAVGVGQQDSPLGIGITLHGTYGWPVIPGSSIKGMACAWAIENQLPAEQILRVFGAPRPHRTEDDAAPPDQPATAAPGIGQDSAEDDVASVGAVRFLDAQAAGVVPVARDVLTPHLQAYYRGADEDPADPGITREPPAEFRNPVPTEFLTVQGSGLEFALIGPEKDVDLAAKWCVAGFDELGIGGKTAAGYGYATITDVEL